ncbi:MAG: hypothetical protein QG620_119 [Patescibacteria group bacterium]|nr:hypothetical protein [Patescibacteria group bacterium]
MLEKRTTILDLFAENELKISELYAIYSRRFPAHKDFWKKTFR